MEEDEYEENLPAGTVLEDKSRGFHLTSNIIVRKWIRIIGSDAFTVWSLFKNFCPGENVRVFPEVKQSDWAEYLGWGKDKFLANLNILIDVGLVMKLPSRTIKLGNGCWKKTPTKYILLEIPDEVPPEILKKYEIQPFRSDCKFNDPIFSGKKELFKKQCSSTSDRVLSGFHVPLLSGRPDHGNSTVYNNTVVLPTIQHILPKGSRKIKKVRGPSDLVDVLSDISSSDKKEVVSSGRFKRTSQASSNELLPVNSMSEKIRSRAEKSGKKQYAVEKHKEEDKIFSHWNTLGICNSRHLDKKVRFKLSHCLKHYSIQEIIQAMNNYSEVFKDDNCWFTSQATFQKFLFDYLDKFSATNFKLKFFKNSKKKDANIYAEEDKYSVKHIVEDRVTTTSRSESSNPLYLKIKEKAKRRLQCQL